jgi:hypothetical protein
MIAVGAELARCPGKPKQFGKPVFGSVHRGLTSAVLVGFAILP